LLFFRGVFLPFGSQHRSERISAIGLELSKGEYDIAILEEVYIVFCHAYNLLLNSCLWLSSIVNSSFVLPLPQSFAMKFDDKIQY